MQYKDFDASYYFVGNLSMYVGEVIDQENHICFAAKNLSDLKEAMQDAVDNYLQAAKLPVFEVE